MSGSGFRASGFESRVQGFWFRVSGSGFRVSGDLDAQHLHVEERGLCAVRAARLGEGQEDVGARGLRDVAHVRLQSE